MQRVAAARARDRCAGALTRSRCHQNSWGGGFAPVCGREAGGGIGCAYYVMDTFFTFHVSARGWCVGDQVRVRGA